MGFAWPSDFNPQKLSPAKARQRLTQFEAGKIARQLLGITQRDAAEAIGVSAISLRRWEAGSHLPDGKDWLRYQRWLIETLIMYASLDNVPRETDLRVGTCVMRQRFGLPGHCARCAELGHRVAHPNAPCKDVGCTRPHLEDLHFVDDQGESDVPPADH